MDSPAQVCLECGNDYGFRNTLHGVCCYRCLSYALAPVKSTEQVQELERVFKLADERDKEADALEPHAPYREGHWSENWRFNANAKRWQDNKDNKDASKDAGNFGVTGDGI